MVIMESCCLPENNLIELWQEIERCHLSYLELEESAEKIEKRHKLEEYIHEFLCITGDYHKFSFQETRNILQLSANHPDFSAYKAAVGFNTIQLYAANLLTQPWRTEYKQLKTYCGFYKHHVEANLTGATKLFEALGYRNHEQGLLVLEEPICPDRVTTVSRDCLIAYVECQILKTIWEEVCKSYKISWLEVLDFRKYNTCSPQEAIRYLTQKHTHRQYHEHSRSLSQGANTYSASHCQTIPVSIPPSMVHLNHSFPPPNAYHNIGLPVQEYIMNGCYSTNYPVYRMPYSQVLTANAYPNKEFVYNIPLPTPNIYPVPIGNLIEVEPSPPSFDAVDSSPTRNRTLRRNEIEYNSLKSNNVADPRDLQLENWDYVYRDLEHQGYSKDLGERGDILSLNTPKPVKELKKNKQTNLDDGFSNLSIVDRPLKVSDAPKKIPKQLIEPNKENRIKTQLREKVISIDKSVQSKTIDRKLKDDKTAKRKQNNTPTRDFKDNIRWDCKFCTYNNTISPDICEMCGKSRHHKDETPIEVGGAECSKCTLVNSKNNKKCEACGTSLEGSPTYI